MESITLTTQNPGQGLVVFGHDDAVGVRRQHCCVPPDLGLLAQRPYPTSGGADKFLDFIQNELMPEIENLAFDDLIT
jgi:hypothetical protein